MRSVSSCCLIAQHQSCFADSVMVGEPVMQQYRIGQRLPQTTRHVDIWSEVSTDIDAAAHLVPCLRPKLHRNSANHLLETSQRLPKQLLALEASQPGVMVRHAHMSHNNPNGTHHCAVPLTAWRCTGSGVPCEPDTGSQPCQQVKRCCPAAVSCLSVGDGG